MSRRGNPYDNAKAESFMKTLKVEAVYPMAYETMEDVAADLRRFIDEVYNARHVFTRRSAISAQQMFEDRHSQLVVKNSRLKMSTQRGALHKGVTSEGRNTAADRRVIVPIRRSRR